MAWKYIFMGIVIVLLAIYLPAIISTVGKVVAEFGDALSIAWRTGARGHRFSSDPIIPVAQLAVVGIIIVGIIKVLKK